MNPVETARYSVVIVRKKGLPKSAHIHLEGPENKLWGSPLHVSRLTFHWARFLIPDFDGFYMQRGWKRKTTVLDAHTLPSRGITWSALPGYLFNYGCIHLYCGAISFHPRWTEVRARSKFKDEVLLQLDGSILLGGTVVSGCCLLVAVMKFHDKFIRLRQVNCRPNSQDKFKYVVPDCIWYNF